MSQPNILFIMADQWAAASLGCFGCDVAGVTPNLDELARRGTRFSRFYANVPVCGPSRATIFTGRSPAAHGVWHNNIEISLDTPLFTQHLRAAGYRNWGVGKFHFSPMQLPPPTDLQHLGFDEVSITEDPKHGPYLEWIAREHPDFYPPALAMSWPMPYLQNYPPHGENLFPAWQEAAKKWVEPQKSAPFRGIFYPSPLPMELHQTRWIADCAIARLEKHDASQPFFGFVSFVDPHDPYDPPAPYAQMFEPREMPPPIAQEWTRDFCARDYAKFQDSMFEIKNFDADDWAQLRALFYGSCRFVDDEIGRILAALRRSGLDENTVVVFLSDHGDLIGDHGLLMKGPWHYDKVVRCPLLVSGPQIPRNEVCEALSCTLDIAPTILELAGVEAPPLEGKTLLNGEGWSEIALQTNASYVNTRGGCRTLVSDKGWRLTLFPEGDYGELFDLKNDPNEQNNLFRDVKHQTRRLEMAERLVGAMARAIYPFPRGEFAEM